MRRLPGLLTALGLRIAGDLGPYTCYTTKRNRRVAYPRSPPKQAPSRLQLTWRNRWRAAAAAWTALGMGRRSDWTAAARAARLSVSGYNLWMSTMLRGDTTTALTVQRQTGIDLL